MPYLLLATLSLKNTHLPQQDLNSGNKQFRLNKSLGVTNGVLVLDGACGR